MCAAADPSRVRSKIPVRADYVPPDAEGVSTPASGRRLGRITPHGPDACIDSAAASGYLNQPEVMKALNVKDPGFCWAVCNTAKTFSYSSTRPNLPRDTYPLLVGSKRVLIFNGDWDACE